MGCDAAGNRYYENRVDYPLFMHRWVEPADAHNFDSTQVPPEWHGWMTHMNDATPSLEEEYVEERMSHLRTGEISHAPYVSNIGHQEPYFNWNHMHNQSQVRSRGYGIGNHVVKLPPGAPDAYYTQPGSPYNDAGIRKEYSERIGKLDENRAYKNRLWAERLKTPQEKEAEKQAEKDSWKQGQVSSGGRKLSPREQAILERGGTVLAAK